MTDRSGVIDNRAKQRFELIEGDEMAIAAYRIEGGLVVFTHTEVPEALEGHGVASRLIAGALDQVRAADARIVPACSFVRHYVDGHPSVQDLLA